ncbi:ATP synthase gamma chain [Beijerinckiaceae bacterium RH AL1]|jgi:F-type H+-transporting ATPase subunit gamma|nr:ATP synthase gamma chain [Beijerinckiaceae bacterium RH CH11]VVB46584.1 ATP synthase gamma chain [Beijerinckiaceae bacterium RH AL8]VVC55406.1 ATP synthase gamma chain [Beijerinckiaceae bacterium RH AL1]
MPSLKDLRNRISSVKATQKITKAMQMVAAAKLRRAQSAAEAARPYAERMERMLARLAAGMRDDPNAPELLRGRGSDKTHLLVVATGERGLCGGFNSSIARLARDKANALLREGKEVKILCIGKKGYDVLRRLFGDRIIELVEVKEKVLSFGIAQPVGAKIVDLFEKGEFDVCTLFFSRFENVVTQVPTALQLIPLQIPEQDDKEERVNYEYEPDEEEILSALLPRNIAIQVFRAMLENAASEQGARMSAMDAATRNAGEMIKKQSLIYNRTRQAMITKELIEIISGAEAL